MASSSAESMTHVRLRHLHPLGRDCDATIAAQPFNPLELNEYVILPVGRAPSALAFHAFERGALVRVPLPCSHHTTPRQPLRPPRRAAYQRDGGQRRRCQSALPIRCICAYAHAAGLQRPLEQLFHAARLVQGWCGGAAGVQDVDKAAPFGLISKFLGLWQHPGRGG